MSSHLVDTHVLLWLVSDDDRLGQRTRAALTASSGVQVSSISVLELTIKAMIGKLSVPSDLEHQLTEQGLRLVPFAAHHAQSLWEFPTLDRHDPFDRALLGQALADGLRLVTADARLLALGLDWIDDATS